MLRIENNNVGLSSTIRYVQDGAGNNSPLQLSQSEINLTGTIKIQGVELTADASALNNITDLTAVTGLVAVSGTNVFGRTLTAGTGVSITNANGASGNPTIAINPSGVSASTYGPVSNITVNAVGQVTSIAVPASISVAEIKGSAFTAETLNASSNVSITGNTHVGGGLTVDGVLSATGIVATSLTFNNNIAVGGASFSAKISGTAAEFSGIVSAANFVGDGSGLTNVPSAEGGTVKKITAGTGVSITINGATSTTIPVSGTILLNANQTFGIVSATNIDADELLIAGVSAATITEVAAVSALTKTNLNAITSINSVIGDGSGFVTDSELATVSAALATSIANRTAAITSINSVVANVSALTSVNTAAVTSINSVVANVSALTKTNLDAITSINTVVGNVSSTMATSIANRPAAIT